MRVLIIDDDAIFCECLAETLQRKGIEAEWTTDGFGGYEMSLDRDRRLSGPCSNIRTLIVLALRVLPVCLGSKVVGCLLIRAGIGLRLLP